MVNPSSIVAHFVKLAVTVGCTKYLSASYRAKQRIWSLRAFQIFLLHSVLGIIRYGTPFAASPNATAKCFRNFYDWFSRIVDIVPLALLTTDILHGYQIDETIRLTLLILGFLPILLHLITGPKESQMKKYYLLPNVSSTLQLLTITLVGLRNGNYGAISLAASYAFQHFFVEELSYRYDVPHTDLTQYCSSFVEFFALLTLKEL